MRNILVDGSGHHDHTAVWQRPLARESAELGGNGSMAGQIVDCNGNVSPSGAIVPEDGLDL